MKSFIAFAMAGLAAAETYPECWDNTVGSMAECKNLFYRLCNTFHLAAGQTCILNTFDNSQITWNSDIILVDFWRLEDGTKERKRDKAG